MIDRIFNYFIQVGAVSTDTRNIVPRSIFFALKGDNFNGNSFAERALELGASMAIVDEELPLKDDRILRVDSVLQTLQNLALCYRRSLDIPFLAITGSNGKTTTKELIREVIAKKYKVHATRGNLNNHIGIPITILSIPKDCEFAIIEMGANHQKEIESYCQFTEPNFGLITNMGKAHLEGFGGEEGVVKGKKELFDYLAKHHGKAFINVELPKLLQAASEVEMLSYGLGLPHFNVKQISENPTLTYSFKDDGGSIETTTKLVGTYNLFNIASAIAVGKYFGVSQPAIHDAISNYCPDNNRSQLVKTGKNQVIMDAYNANPSSMSQALVSLSNLRGNNEFIILGEMRELGNESLAEHESILRLATELQLEGIVIGKHFFQHAAAYPFKAFQTSEMAKKYIEQNPIESKMILLKGSRGMRLEDLMPLL